MKLNNADYIKFIINQFNVTFKENYPTVYVGHTKLEDGTIKHIDSSPEKWVEIIDVLIDKGISSEDYELCGELTTFRETVKEESEKRLKEKEVNEEKQ